MYDMRSSFFILLTSALLACTGIKYTLDKNDIDIGAQPMELFIDSEFSTNNKLPFYVAKVYRKNNFTQSGAFISSNGLFVTNFQIALEYFNTSKKDSIEWLTHGFLADNMIDELPLPGVSLAIEVDQIDISDAYNNKIEKKFTNYDIALLKQSVGEQVIASERSKNPNLFYDIKEIHDGHRFILTKYKIINDVRLVFAPATGINSKEITDSEQVLKKIKNLPVFLRGYVTNGKKTASYSVDNIPYLPEYYFRIEGEIQQISSSKVIGFPDHSYRLDPFIALEFYNKSINPLYVKSHTAFQAKEERKAIRNKLYAYKSLGNRVHNQNTLNYYIKVQKSFEKDSILLKKKTFDTDLKALIDSSFESSVNENFKVIFNYLSEAYAMANRQGDIFYASSYFFTLSQLDELALNIREYLNSTSENSSTTQLQKVLKNQTLLLNSIDVKEELLILVDFIFIFNELPFSQVPFSVQDIFAENPNISLRELEEFVNKTFGENTVLFDSTKFAESIKLNEISYDPLFLFLDELLFANEVSTSNHSIFLAYVQPAQRVYNDAIRLLLNQPLVTSEADGLLRTNKGLVINNNKTKKFEGFFNFTTKSFGSAVVNNDGKLIGIIGDSLTPNIASTYLFSENSNSYPIIRISDYVKVIESLNPSSKVLQDINNKL